MTSAKPVAGSRLQELRERMAALRASEKAAGIVVTPAPSALPRPTGSSFGALLTTLQGRHKELQAEHQALVDKLNGMHGSFLLKCPPALQQRHAELVAQVDARARTEDFHKQVRGVRPTVCECR